jgi:hypothetical protein
MFVTDLNHFLHLPEDTPCPARRLAEHLGNIVRAATAGAGGTAWESALACRRRPAHRRCRGRLIVLRTQPGTPIQWRCSVCDDEGVISNWEDSPFDLRRRRLALAGAVNEIVISEDVATTLRDLRLLDTDGERLVFAIRTHNNGAVLAATEEDLDELIGFGPKPTMSPTDVANSDSTSHSMRSTPQPRHLTAADSMALPELDVARVRRWCAARVPEHARHQVRVECTVTSRHLTIVERRMPWCDDVGPEWTSFPIARLSYTATDKSWTLYWRDRNLRFHSYDPLAPSQRVGDLLTEIDRDPTCIFWG